MLVTNAAGTSASTEEPKGANSTIGGGVKAGASVGKGGSGVSMRASLMTGFEITTTGFGGGTDTIGVGILCSRSSMVFSPLSTINCPLLTAFNIAFPAAE